MNVRVWDEMPCFMLSCMLVCVCVCVCVLRCNVECAFNGIKMKDIMSGSQPTGRAVLGD